jgi:hypothetical protein
MRRASAVLLVAAAFAVVGASAAMADVVTSTRTASTFTSNDSLHWSLLGVNTFVANGSALFTTNGILTTVNFGTGGPGSTATECPTSTCTWGGDFAPGDILLTSANSGRIILSFATGISAIGFQLEPNAGGPMSTFSTEIAVYDGSTLLDTFYFPDGVQSHAMNNSAGFYGVIDSTADITSIQVLAYNCGSVAGGACFGFAINSAKIEDAAVSKTPEPASLALLGSGFGMLGFLRRKLAARK